MASDIDHNEYLYTITTYSPTNGVLSNGDIWGLVQPPVDQEMGAIYYGIWDME